MSKYIRYNGQLYKAVDLSPRDKTFFGRPMQAPTKLDSQTKKALENVLAKAKQSLPKGFTIRSDSGISPSGDQEKLGIVIQSSYDAPTQSALAKKFDIPTGAFIFSGEQISKAQQFLSRLQKAQSAVSRLKPEDIAKISGQANKLAANAQQREAKKVENFKRILGDVKSRIRGANFILNSVDAPKGIARLEVTLSPTGRDEGRENMAKLQRATLKRVKDVLGPQFNVSTNPDMYSRGDNFKLVCRVKYKGSLL